jgi:hypothetical protein
MKKFIVLYNAPADAAEKMKESGPEEHKKVMEEWFAWKKKCGDGLVDFGSPLGECKCISEDGEEENTKNVIGYSIIQAENMTDAENLCKDHPHLKWDKECSIEIRECMNMPSSM